MPSTQEEISALLRTTFQDGTIGNTARACKLAPWYHT